MQHKRVDCFSVSMQTDENIRFQCDLLCTIICYCQSIYRIGGQDGLVLTTASYTAQVPLSGELLLFPSEKQKET